MVFVFGKIVGVHPVHGEMRELKQLPRKFVLDKIMLNSSELAYIAARQISSAIFLQ